MKSLQNLRGSCWILWVNCLKWQRLDCASVVFPIFEYSANWPNVTARLVLRPLRSLWSALLVLRTTPLAAVPTRSSLSMCDISGAVTVVRELYMCRGVRCAVPCGVRGATAGGVECVVHSPWHPRIRRTTIGPPRNLLHRSAIDRARGKPRQTPRAAHELKRSPPHAMPSA